MKLIARSVTNAIEVPRLLLKELGIKISNQTLANKLEDHPDFPSLMAVSDCLNEWHIPNAAYRIAKEEYNAQELQFPFIAQTPANGGMFMLVHQIAHGTVIYSDERSKRKEISKEEFLKRWSGILLYAERGPQSGEEGYVGKQLRETIANLKMPAVVLLLAIAILQTLNFSEMSWGYGLLLLLKCFGIGVSVLLLLHSINANNPLVQNLCSLGKKNNCNAILKSDAAQATSWLSWSEVGFFYFAGSFLALLFVPSSLTFIIWLNMLSIPYTFWSVFYQYRHKNWCVLCCTVQAILWLELVTAALPLPASFDLTTSNIGILPTLLLCFLAPVLLWYVLKPMLRKDAEHQMLKGQLKKFKYNSELFVHALTKQPRYAVPNEIAPINLGNPQASTVITMVSNPFCGPCAKAHETLDKWLKTRDDIQLKIVFTTADHDDDQRTKVARHITALSLTNQVELVEKALNHWYAQREKKYEEWASAYQVNMGDEVNEASKKQKQWCEMAEITFTPTILINGYKLPEPYRLEDIRYLIN